MVYIIANFKHFSGRHCGSTSCQAILNFYGLPLSEAICFGLGSAIYVNYNLPSPNLPIFISGRTPFFEEDTFANLGCKVTIKDSSNAEQSQEELITKIKNNIPLIIWVDLYYLNYFKSRHHFSVHRVIAFGVDEEKKVFYISDNEREETQIVSFADIISARNSKAFPFPTANRFFDVQKPEKFIDLKIAIKTALKKTKEIMLGKSGCCERLKKLSEEILNLESYFLENPQNCQLLYLSLEKWGTGGGNFRFLYSDFLKELKDIFLENKFLKLSEQMQKSAENWQQVALNFKDLGLNKNKAKVKEISKNLLNIYNLEKEVFETLSEII